MQTNESNYSNLSDYDNSSEEVFFDMKTSETNDSSMLYDQMTEDEMPIPENCEDDSLSEKESLPTSKIKKENTVTNNPPKEKKSSKQNKSTAKEDNIKITDVKIRREASYDIAELTISKPVKIMRKNQGGQLLKLRIIPPVKFTDKKNKEKLNQSFEKTAVYETEYYTEILFSSKGKIGNPYTASDTTGIFKLCVPYQSRKSRFSLRKGEEIAEGLTYYHDRGKSGSGWSDVHILRIEALSDKIQVLPILANEGIAQRENLSSMAKRYNAVAGINGSYFTWRGDPIGTLIINRKLISSPLYKRSVFGITEDDKLIFGNPDFSGTLRSGKITLKIDAVNQPRRGSSLVVFTPEYARSTLTAELGKEFVIVKGKIVGIHKKDALIPPDGVVVSAGGVKASMLSSLSLGNSVELDYSIDKPWNSIKHALCGGPRLLANGKVSINGIEEKFDNSIINGRHPRTAVAMTFDGDLLLIAVDGRKKDSIGMKLQELAEYLQRLGCMHAINLDGGGSTAMYLNGKIINRPSDGSERRISNGILVTKR
jgi:exopolysaccharide biosynthesis protein